MRDLISIGRFAQATGLTIKALHIYDEVGLLRPAIVDDLSGYRYYSITQLPIARQIRMLRSIDMPLDAIHDLLHAPSDAIRDARLREHEQRLVARIAKEQQSLRLTQQIIDHQTDDVSIGVRTKLLPPQLVASIRFQATPAEESRMIPLLITELEHYTARWGVRSPDQPALRISHEYSESLVDSEVAIALFSQIPHHERIAIRELEVTTVAYVAHTGPHADLWAVYWAILVWLLEHGYEQNGPPREVYWSPPMDGHSVAYRTEVQWPVRTLDRLEHTQGEDDAEH